MASTSNHVDYSFSNDDKIILHNQNSLSTPNDANNIEKSMSEINKATSIDLAHENLNNSQCSDKDTPQEKDSVPVGETITKLENILKDLKMQKDVSPEYKRIIREVSQKRSRKQTRKYTSSPRRRCDSSSDSSVSHLERSPLPKRTRKESPRKKYDSDYSIQSKEERYKFRERSPSTSSTDRSYSCVSKKLKKELSNFLGNSFVSINSKRHKNSRRNRREVSYDRSGSPSESHDRSRYSRRDTYDKSRYSRRDDTYDRYQKKKFTRKHADKYNNYNRHYQQNDIEERYSRYYAVMYAFSIIMDILRQDDIYSTF